MDAQRINGIKQHALFHGIPAKAGQDRKGWVICSTCLEQQKAEELWVGNGATLRNKPLQYAFPATAESELYNPRITAIPIIFFRKCNAPGKLSYTYWRGFERYDQAWGLSAKYAETMSKLSKEALELDRQYKIRQKTLRCYLFILPYMPFALRHLVCVAQGREREIYGFCCFFECATVGLDSIMEKKNGDCCAAVADVCRCPPARRTSFNPFVTCLDDPFPDCLLLRRS